MNDDERRAALALRAEFMAQVEEFHCSPTAGIRRRWAGRASS